VADFAGHGSIDNAKSKSIFVGCICFFFFFSLFFGFGVVWILSLHDTYVGERTLCIPYYLGHKAMWLSHLATRPSDFAIGRSHLATLPYGRDNTVCMYFIPFTLCSVAQPLRTVACRTTSPVYFNDRPLSIIIYSPLLPDGTAFA
jgi:hypothetical protein